MRWRLNWRLDWRIDWRGLDEDTTEVPGQGPSGVVTSALDLENGFTVTLRWPTDIIKTRSGKEQRISRNDRAKESYSGSALLLGDRVLEERARLARFAATGSVFSLGLPHEALLLQADSVGTTVYVSASQLALTDWQNPGQRVLVVREDEDGELESVEAVIQSTTSSTIVLNVEPGDVGKTGGVVMPLVPTYLEPQQDFERYPLDAERWKIRARAASFDFAVALHSLALGPLTTHAGLENATVVQRRPGEAVSIRFATPNIASSDGVHLSESPGAVIVMFDVGGPTPGTVEDVLAALQASTYVQPGGTWGTGNLTGGDAFALTPLTGGGAQGPVGTGATVDTYDGDPLWDREIITNGTITDGIHALTEMVDHDGVPAVIGLADVPDWHRTLAFTGHDREDWQWFKLFLATTKGPQKAFWLSTWRDDLPCTAVAGSTLTVEGDVGAWYPAQRQHLHVQDDGEDVYCAITSATDNGDGTWDLVTDASAFTAPTMVSWLERCRFEKDEIVVTFDQHGFSMSTIARVVQQ